MSHVHVAGQIGLLSVLLTAQSGCIRQSVLALSHVLGVKPIGIGIVTENPIDAIVPFTAYDGLCRRLSKATGRNVVAQPCAPFQVESYLDSGFYQFAVVTPAQYARLSNRDALTVVAAPKDRQERLSRAALLLVASDSNYHEVTQLRNKLIAFGPSGDSRTHIAALELLKEHGIGREDLRKDLLPIPGSLRHVADARAVVRSVASGGSDAGFIDEADWQTSAQAADSTSIASAERFRVIGRTIALPDALIVASPKAPSEVIDQVRTFLIAASEENADILEPLKISGYVHVSQDLIRACAALAGSSSSGD